ncbi:hypothetical protein B0H67DRAFT_648504 [Lasiosphaeris hirsuta]|uniref:SnoaL-like domain-containing protein n=1 Tax=Lasiosphaeris hirsuta TaxID=260670 RepID=A0AA40A366_9PEZI|nr:hypothetical protein B0H67DRAFT_648504 [Lasiosphaeris hirsuta]
MATDTLHQAMSQTLDRFLHSYLHASEHNDASYVSAGLTPDCERHIKPASFLTGLGAPADLTFAPQAYQDIFSGEMSFAQTKSVQISDVTIDTASRKAAATVVYVNEFVDDGERVTMEFAFFLSFTEDGSQITKILEWVDSGDCPKYQVKIHERREKAAAAGK